MSNQSKSLEPTIPAGVAASCIATVLVLVATGTPSEHIIHAIEAIAVALPVSVFAIACAVAAQLAEPKKQKEGLELVFMVCTVASAEFLLFGWGELFYHFSTKAGNAFFVCTVALTAGFLYIGNNIRRDSAKSSNDAASSESHC